MLISKQKERGIGTAAGEENCQQIKWLLQSIGKYISACAAPSG